MAYDPGITYQGGQMWANALSSLGTSAADAIKEYQKAKEDQAANDMIINHVLQTQDPQNPILTPEQHQKYIEGSATQKNGIVAGLARSLALDIQKQNQQEVTARTALYGAQAGATGAEADLRRAQQEAIQNEANAPIAVDPNDPYTRVRITSRGPKIPIAQTQQEQEMQAIGNPQYTRRGDYNDQTKTFTGSDTGKMIEIMGADGRPRRYGIPEWQQTQNQLQSFLKNRGVSPDPASSKFWSVDQARAAGAKKGDTVTLYDPGTNKFRPWIMGD